MTIPNIFDSQQIRHVKKGEVLVESGKRAHEAFYVVKGCLRSFIVDEKGKEHIFQFAPEDWIISDIEFLKTNDGAYLSIDAIEDSEVKTINIETIYQLSNMDAKTIDDVFLKFQYRIYALQKRIIHLLAYTADQRYDEFLKTYPQLSNRIPLKMIASYLGVTPESLSRVRKQLSQKQ